MFDRLIVMKKSMASVLLNSIFLISVSTILIGTGTWAFFKDNEKSPNYSAATVQLDLKVSDADENGGGHDGVQNTWVMSNALPGLSTVAASVWFRNAGTVKADHLEIGVNNQVIDPPGPESDSEEDTTDMDKVVQIMEMNYITNANTFNCLSLLADSNANGYKDLDDLEAQGLDNLEPPLKSNSMSSHLDMSLRFHESADNDYQGDTLYSEFVFTLNQDDSQ